MIKLLIRSLGILLILGNILSCNQKSQEQVAYDAFYQLLRESPVDQARYRQLYNDGHRIVIKVNNQLTDTTLARTTITYENPIIIEVDFLAIQQHHDNLVPVIAHELDHAWEATYQYGLPTFFALVAKQKEEQNLPWSERTFEKSAIQKENETRQYLLSHYPQEYRGMSSQRIIP
jgi:hypothetical protein